jgi:hypothetical protein
VQEGLGLRLLDMNPCNKLALRPADGRQLLCTFLAHAHACMELRLKTKTSVFFLHGAIILATELVNLANDDGTSRPCILYVIRFQERKKQGIFLILARFG